MISRNHQIAFKRSLPSEYLIRLLVGCCLLFLAGCTKVTPVAVTFKPTRISTVAAITKSESTQVIIFHPRSVPSQERTGSCWSTSNVLNRVDAWRCTSDNTIYDPCFSSPENSQVVICDTSPLTDSTGFKLNLTGSLPVRGTVSPVTSAWVFELADGTNCSFLGGATATFEGKRVNYSCSDGWFILGELQEGQVWTARKIRISSDLSSIEESTQVIIKIVWL
jgi:hypothetical protein